MQIILLSMRNVWMSISSKVIETALIFISAHRKNS
uniref:Uncharacterized protein n=1 Tax=Arundo donax TaxID=35708 RepID=A0A0A9GZT1_ARUDO